jgi:hypothetical protein
MKADNIRSTCDSERILNKYLEFNVNKNPAAIQPMVDSLTGNFACGIITKDVNGKRVVDVFKSRANLGGGVVRELDNAMVITTDKSDIKSVCKHLGMKMLGGYNAKEDVLIRFDAISGKAMLSLKYQDTARPQWNNNRSTAHGGNGLGRYDHHLQRYVYDSERSSDSSTVVTQKELEDKRAANATKREEERAAADTSYTQQELDDIYAKALKEVADKKEEAIKNVTSDLQQSKEIIAKASNIYDPLYENEATKDGYYLDRDGSWGKLDKKVD